MKRVPLHRSGEPDDAWVQRRRIWAAGCEVIMLAKVSLDPPHGLAWRPSTGEPCQQCPQGASDRAS